MNDFLLLSDRLKWAVEQKKSRDTIEISNSDLGRVAKKSRTSVTYWMTGGKITAAPARLLGDYLGVDAIWLETGEGKPDLIKPSNNHVKNTTLKELTTTDPLQGMANKHKEVFMSLSEKNRELLQMLANKMYDQDHPTDTRSTGKKLKIKDKEKQ